ncbi:MAG: hypothetical protein QXJ64_04095 [Thermosphaera sp.]
MISVLFVIGLPLVIVGLRHLVKYLIFKQGILESLAGLKATFAYILYLTPVDIFKATKSKSKDFVSQAISKSKDLNFLCKPVRRFLC